MRRLTVAAAVLALLSVPAALAASATGSSPATSAARQARSVTNGRLAFLANAAGQRQLFTIKPDGTGLDQITHVSVLHRLRRRLGAGRVSLLYVATGTHDVIYRIASDGSGATTLSPPCKDQCLGDDYPDYNHTGTKIAFERAYGPIKNETATGGIGIYTMNSDGTGLRQLTQRSKATPPKITRRPGRRTGRP